MKKILFIIAFLPFAAHAQYISTIAGTTSGGYSGNGGPATSAQLRGPAGAAFDNAGNMYIADKMNHVVRKVTTSGIISTIAGGGTTAAGGYTGPATNANIGNPMKICIDSANNLYIPDNANHYVYKVNGAGIISTITGSGAPIYSGSGVPATAASVASPTCVVIDHAGNLYVGSANSKTVMKIDYVGTMTLFAGNYGVIPVGGDGGPATNAGIGSVAGLAFDNAGRLYIADGNGRVRMVDTAGIIHTVAGTSGLGYSGTGGPATAATFDGVSAVAVDGIGNLYVADRNNFVIRKVDTSGIVTTIAGQGPAASGSTGDGGPAAAARLNGTSSLTISPTGKLVLCEENVNKVRIIDQCPYGVITSPLSTTVNMGANAVFTTSTTVSPVTYQWQGNSGSGYYDLLNVLPYTGVTTNTLTILNTATTLDFTTYRCLISKGAGCNNDTTGAALLRVNNTIGVLGTVKLDQLTIYPNPAREYVDVKMQQNGVVTIYNEVGAIVYAKELAAQTNRIDLKGLPEGLYILKLTSGTETVYRKLNKL